MAGKKEESNVYIVIPRTEDAMKEGFVRVNNKVIPFDRKVKLVKNDVEVIRRMKEPTQGSTVNISVSQIMEEYKIPQEEANKIARARAQQANSDNAIGKKIMWIPKYSVHPA